MQNDNLLVFGFHPNTTFSLLTKCIWLLVSLCWGKFNTQLCWAIRTLNFLPPGLWDLSRWLLTISDSYFPAADVGLTGLPGYLGVAGAALCRAWFILTAPTQPPQQPPSSSLQHLLPFSNSMLGGPDDWGTQRYAPLRLHKAFRSHSCQSKGNSPRTGNNWDIYTVKMVLTYLGHCFSKVDLNWVVVTVNPSWNNSFVLETSKRKQIISHVWNSSLQF